MTQLSTINQKSFEDNPNQSSAKLSLVQWAGSEINRKTKVPENNITKMP